MSNKLSVKIAGILILVMIIIMSIFTAYFVRTQTKSMEMEILSRGRIEAVSGAKIMERILNEALDSGRFKMDELFDEQYLPIGHTDPPKYHTRYDTFLDGAIQGIEDEYLKDEQVVFAVLVDRNGYLPTHNTSYTQPLTGDSVKDKVGNRTKRLFKDEVGSKAAKNDQPLQKQEYNRDTGEIMWDISAPVVVKGRHWGGFRIGFSMDKTYAKIASVRNQIIGSMVFLLVVSSLTIFIVINRSIQPLNELK